MGVLELEDAGPGGALGAPRLAASRLAPAAPRRPRAARSWARVRVAFCGACGSDAAECACAWTGGAPPELPLVPGHEIVGTVEEAPGDAPAWAARGAWVGVGCMVASCGSCRRCSRGEEQFCNRVAWTYGSRLDDDGEGACSDASGDKPAARARTTGGFATHVVADVRFLVPLPEAACASPSALAATAPLLCAGATAYSALKAQGLLDAGSGRRAAVVGLGGVGHLMVRLLASVRGADAVAVVSRARAKEAEARALGAGEFIELGGETSPSAGTFDVVFDTASGDHDVEALLELLDVGGTLVQVGLPPGGLTLSPFALPARRLSVQGTFIAGVAETAEAVREFVSRGILPSVDVVPATAETASEVLRLLSCGEGGARRYVLDMAPLHEVHGANELRAATGAPWYDGARARALGVCRGVRGSLWPAGGADSVHEAFFRAAERWPDAPALASPLEARRTYRELAASARALAAHLREVAGGRAAVAAAAGRTPVAACMLPSCGVRICAYFATLAAGLAYCPIEIGHPEATARTLLAAVDATVFVAAPSLVSLAPEGIPTVALTWESVEGLRGGAALPPPARNAVAHVVFTSGSTGTPKGVVCAHAGSLASHAWRHALQPYRPGDVVASCIFGIWDAVGALLHGASVAPVAEETLRSPRVLGLFMLRARCNRIMITPSLLGHALCDTVCLAALRACTAVVTCGEPLPQTMAAQAMSALSDDGCGASEGRSLMNLYSCAETHDVAAEVARLSGTVGAAEVTSTAERLATVGVVAPHAEVLVMRSLEPPVLAGVGEEGEVVVTGDLTLASGYYNQDDGGVSAKGRFFDLDGVRAYSTGDRGALREDGRLAISGRDEQTAVANVRGHTVSLLDVEHALRAVGALQAVAAVAPDAKGRDVVVALVPPGVEPPAEELLARLKTEGTLPSAAMPARVLVTDSPLVSSASGKADRTAARALAAKMLKSEAALSRGALNGAPEATSSEGELAEAVRCAIVDELGCDAGLDSDFFELGGDSLSAVAMLGALSKRVGDESVDRMSWDEFAACPTPRGIAHLLSRADAAGSAGASVRASEVIGDVERLALRVRARVDDAASASAGAVEATSDSKTVLVLGAAGLIGGHVVSCFLRHGYAVMGLARAPDAAACRARVLGNLERLALLEEAEPFLARLQCVPGNLIGLRESAAWEELLRAGVAVVVNCAGCASMAASYAELSAANVEGAALAWELAATVGAQLHHISSSVVFPPRVTPYLDSELPRLDHLEGGYAMSKWGAEAVLVKLSLDNPRAAPPQAILHRVGNVRPARTAAREDADGAAAVMSACVALGAFPEGLAATWECAGRLAKGILAVSLRGVGSSRGRSTYGAGPPVRVVHHSTAERVRGEDLMAALHAAGHPRVVRLPAEAWAALVRSAVAEHQSDRAGAPGCPRALAITASLLRAGGGGAVGVAGAIGARDAALVPSVDGQSDAVAEGSVLALAERWRSGGLLAP